jgi:hypothetical protein
MIFRSVIEVALNYTQWGRVLLTLRELMSRLDPRHNLGMRMIINDEG